MFDNGDFFTYFLHYCLYLNKKRMYSKFLPNLEFSKLLEFYFFLLEIYFYTGQKILFIRFLKLEKKLFTGKKVFFTGRLNCRQRESRWRRVEIPHSRILFSRGNFNSLDCEIKIIFLAKKDKAINDKSSIFLLLIQFLNLHYYSQS